MVQKWQRRPQTQVTVRHSAVNYIIDAQSVINQRVENGFDLATVTLEDKDARNYKDKVTEDDLIKIEQKDASDAAWTIIFRGIIRRAEPSNFQANILNLKCDGSGYGLASMLCADEYGTESANPTLDTVTEIINDGSHGMLSAWVNTVLGDTGTASGHIYENLIQTITDSFKYIYFPFKPVTKCLNDLCELVQGNRGANAGIHWFVTPGLTAPNFYPRLCIAEVGNHADAPLARWPNWWRTDQAGSTLDEDDLLSFKFQHLAKEANYVLYHGKVVKPLLLDDYTEDAADWAGGLYMTPANDTAKVGSNSIKATTKDTGAALKNCTILYPTGSSLGPINVTNMGGKYDVPICHAWAKVDGNVWGNNRTLFFYFRTGVGDGAIIGAPVQVMFSAASEWTEFTFPIGPYYHYALHEPKWLRNYIISGAFSWASVEQIGLLLLSDANGEEVWLDNYYLSGSVIRGARQAAAFTSSNPCRLKIITDDLAKDDTLKASDDSGTIGQLCYAVYLRSITTPIVGTFTIPIANDLIAGQKIHVHAKKKADDTFQIDDDFRITKIIHAMSSTGCYSTVDVTDDLKNSIPRPIPTHLNKVLSAVRPEFQDRQATSMKARSIDITQPILEKTY